jgi:DNA repair protein SbcC/Rad50
MKITLKHISILNFKGIRELEFDFEKNTNICGRNASGKTSIFDAFLWCLFGKDSSGRSDSANGGFMVKTVGEDGEFIRNLDHIVTVILDIDGQEKKLCRQLKEEWSTVRGSTERKLRGNTTHYYVDGVEVNGNAGKDSYSSTINAICDEELFRQITNPAYFAQMHWQKQREMLIAIAGDVSLSEIANGRKEYDELISKMASIDAAEYKKRLGQMKRSIDDEMKSIDQQIAGIKVAMPKESDMADARAEKKLVEDEMKKIDAQISDVSMEQAERNEKKRAIVQEIGELQIKSDRILSEANAGAEKEERQFNIELKKLRDIKSEKEDAVRSIVAKDKTRRDDAVRRIDENTRTVNDLKVKREKLIGMWHNVNDRKFPQDEKSCDEMLCPIGNGAPCTNEFIIKKMMSEKDIQRKAFAAKKQEDMDSISKEGNECRKRIDAIFADIDAIQKEEDEAAIAASQEASKLDGEVKDAEMNITLLETRHNATVSDKKEIRKEELPECIKIDKEIAAKRAEIEAIDSVTDEDSKLELNEQKNALYERLNKASATLADIENIKHAETEIDSRKNRINELSQEFANLDNEEYKLDELIHEQSDAIEERVNDLFKVVRFKLYEKQINGDEKPTCTSTVGGVRYADLNNAMKINAGIDIINAISKFTGVCAPIFIDNAESVNKLFDTDTQLVRLVVTHGELTINY